MKNQHKDFEDSNSEDPDVSEETVENKSIEEVLDELEYFDKFKEEDIDMETVLQMNESDLKELCLKCGIK